MITADLITRNQALYLVLVAAAYLAAARNDRAIHPVGSFDKAGRWVPSSLENSDNFTAHIRTPSRSWPNTYNKAARSWPHCLALADVAPEFVLEQARKLHGFRAFEAGDLNDMAKKAMTRAINVLKTRDADYLAAKAVRSKALAETKAMKAAIQAEIDRSVAEERALLAAEIAAAINTGRRLKAERIAAEEEAKAEAAAIGALPTSELAILAGLGA